MTTISAKSRSQHYACRFISIVQELGNNVHIIIGTMIVTIISMELYMLNKFSRLRFKFGFKPRAGGVRLLYYRHWPGEKDKECCTAIGTPRMGIVAKIVYKYAKLWFQNA